MDIFVSEKVKPMDIILLMERRNWMLGNLGYLEVVVVNLLKKTIGFRVVRNIYNQFNSVTVE